MKVTPTVVKEFMQKHGLKQAHIAKSIAVSSAMISQYLNGGYRGDVGLLEEKLENYISNYSFSSAQEVDAVVETRNIKMSHFIINELIVSRKMGKIVGEAGSGKTTMIREFVRKHPEAILIEAIPGITKKETLEMIAVALNVGKTKSLFGDIVKALKMRDAVLIIDEAENFTTNTLETIRRVHDFSQVPTVLVGTHALTGNLKGRSGELLQLNSRINRKVTFGELSIEEWQALLGDVYPYITKISKNLRIAKDNIYDTAKRFADMQGEDLNIGHIEAILDTVEYGG